MKYKWMNPHLGRHDSDIGTMDLVESYDFRSVIDNLDGDDRLLFLPEMGGNKQKKKKDYFMEKRLTLYGGKPGRSGWIVVKVPGE